jgi:hypothetical protein
VTPATQILCFQVQIFVFLAQLVANMEVVQTEPHERLTPAHLLDLDLQSDEQARTAVFVLE